MITFSFNDPIEEIKALQAGR